MQVYPGTYRDSLLPLSATRAMVTGPGELGRAHSSSSSRT